MSVAIQTDSEGRVTTRHNFPEQLTDAQKENFQIFDSIPAEPAYDKDTQVIKLFVIDGVLEWKTQKHPKLDTSRITVGAFRDRFTFPEKVAIKTAAKSDAEVAVVEDDWASKKFIDLLDSNLEGNVDFLISKGILDADRKAGIMSLEVTFKEVVE